MKKSRLLVAVCIYISAVCAMGNAQAYIVTVEPDDFLLGQDLTNVVAGVTLSVADGTGVPQLNDQVEAFQGDFSSTGSLVFGRQVAPFTPDDSWFLTSIFVHSIFRADFGIPVDEVSIDVIRTSAADSGAIMAFDSSDNLLDTVVVGLGTAGTFATATISRPTADIAYILAGGYPVTSGPPFSVVALDNLQFNVALRLVEIDIKPYEQINNINPGSRGLLPVAVLTSGDFDALLVDPATVRFGPAGAIDTHGRAHVKDIDNDGDMDLLFHFRTRETGISCGDTEATLTGQTWDGTLISGTDSVNTVSCR